MRIAGTLLEITDTRQAIERLREGEARLKGFLDAAPDAMVIVDQAGKIILANTRAESVFGYTQAELLGKDVDSLLPAHFRGSHSQRRDDFVTRFGHLTTGIEREIFGLRKDGTQFPAEISLSAHEVDNEVVVLAAVRDTTGRKRVEAALRKNQQLLEEAQSIASMQTWTADLKTRRIEIGPGENRNPGWLSSGQPLEDMLKIVHPLDRDRVASVMEGVISSGGLDVEYRILPGSELKWVHVKARLALDDNGRPVSLLGIAQDITERKQVEEFAAAQRDLALGMSTMISPEEVWSRCLEIALRVSGMDSGGIYWLDQNRGVL
jgi:PAS domain S-box-containing protein